MTLKLYRKVGDPAIYTVVAHDGPRFLVADRRNRFTTSLPVQRGDVLGLNDGQSDSRCVFPAPGQSFLERVGDLADGASGSFSTETDGYLNIRASVEPASGVTFGKVRRNLRRGTAILPVTIPNSGTLSFVRRSPKQADAKSTARATTSALKQGNTVSTAPATVGLLVKAHGKRGMRLKNKGSVRVGVKVAYHPFGASRSALHSRRVTLKKRL
jgi:hypothetical protein